MKLDVSDWILLGIAILTISLFGIGLILLGIFLWKLGTKWEKEINESEMSSQNQNNVEFTIRINEMKSYDTKTLEELK